MTIKNIATFTPSKTKIVTDDEVTPFESKEQANPEISYRQQ